MSINSPKKEFSDFQLIKKLEPEEIINEAIKQYNVDSFYVGFSGGKDSVVCTHFMSENYPNLFKGVIFCDTTIGTDKTKKFVKDYCKEMNWPLTIVKAKVDYETMVKTVGFPGPASHTITMRYLKLIPMREKINEFIAAGQKPCIVSGVRKAESDRRFINAKNSVHKDGTLIFASIMIDKSNQFMYEYFIKNNLKKSPVYETLHISGDCLCGCFSDLGEAKLLDIFHPEVAKKIRYLESEIKKGNCEKAAFKHRSWGQHYSSLTGMADQLTLESFLCSECRNDRANNSNEFLEELEIIEKQLKNVERRM